MKTMSWRHMINVFLIFLALLLQWSLAHILELLSTENGTSSGHDLETLSLPKLEQRGKTLKDLEKECGISLFMEYRIVGGYPAELNAWPWMAAIFVVNSPGGRSKVSCGGVLVSDFYVLTAAHCVINDLNKTKRAVNEFVVRLGDLDITNDKDGANPVDFNVSEVITHPQFDYKAFKNDIALLRLAKSANFSDSIRPICLPTPEMNTRNLEGRTSTIAGWSSGWGAVEYRDEWSPILRQVQLWIYNNTECQKAYGKFNATILSSHLCAGYPLGGKDVCEGDSGGPLMLASKNRWYTIGVASFGYKCGEVGIPGIYTRIATFLDWIKTNAKLK